MKHVYTVLKFYNGYTTILGLFSSYKLAKAEANRYINQYGFETLTHDFVKMSGGWKMETEDQSEFVIWRYEIDKKAGYS